MPRSINPFPWDDLELDAGGLVFFSFGNVLRTRLDGLCAAFLSTARLDAWLGRNWRRYTIDYSRHAFVRTL